jgi:hypothetical protein
MNASPFIAKPSRAQWSHLPRIGSLFRSFGTSAHISCSRNRNAWHRRERIQVFPAQGSSEELVEKARCRLLAAPWMLRPILNRGERD